MNRSLCFLFGAGEYDGTFPIIPASDDYVIAVDGGLDHLTQTDILPELVIGDFDSAASGNPYNNPVRDSSVTGQTNIHLPDAASQPVPYEILAFPPEKDYTDMYLGIQEGIRHGYKSFVIYGGLGGRVDHSLANIQILAWLSIQGLSGFLIGGNQVITTITNSTFEVKSGTTRHNRLDSLFEPVSGRYISILSHNNTSEGVTIKGLQYETDNITLTNSFALGTSNSYTGSDYSISVQNGTLIIISELS